MATPPFIPLNVDKFNTQTMHLSLEEDGAYNRLLRLCWSTPGCSVPADHGWIQRKLRVTAEVYLRSVQPVIDEYFQVENGRFVQDKLRREYVRASALCDSRSEAGKKGAANKALKTNNSKGSAARPLLKHLNSNLKESPLIPQGEDIGDHAQKVIDAWNELARRAGFSVAALTDRRRKAIKARVGAETLSTWTAALKAVEASPFCRGLVKDKAFLASIDFVLQPSTFEKLLSGFYGTGAPPALAAIPEAPKDPLAIWRHRVYWFTKNEHWDMEWRGKPGGRGMEPCIVPPEILAEFGFAIEPTPQISAPLLSLVQGGAA